VITGASSGIGRATAHAFARQGARVVLAARSTTSLEEVRAECEELGGEALVVPTDVTSDEDVANLVASTIRSFGRIDVWVGAAAVFAYGRFDQVPDAVFRELLEINLFGQARGVRAVLPHMQRQGSGTIVLIGSVYSRLASAYVSAYITSKHAVLGLADSIRQEVRDDGIEVCAVLPATADTPIYQHAANYLGRRAHPLPPVIAPERVARVIVRLADRPRASVIVGRIQRFGIPAHRIAPRLAGWLTTRVMNRVAVQPEPAPETDGTVFEPRPESNAVSGGWRRKRK
jgi:NAD(P)-dependent dehydrogenase (short-subunit alcohol dehydrogenase family)